MDAVVVAPTPAPPRQPQVSARCTGCGRCVAACAPHVLWLDLVGDRKRAVLHQPAGCTGCADCAVVCPVNAIRMQRGRDGAVAP